MRRTAFWPVLALTLIVLSGNGTAAPEELRPEAAPAPMPIPEMPVPPGLALPESAQALAPVAPEVPVPLAPPVTTRVLALPDNNFSIPPDTHGAVGPTKVMTVLNTQVNVQLHDGTQVGGYPISLNTFWDGLRTDLNGPLPPAPVRTFDPRVKFDPDPAYGGRWIWVSVQDARGPDSGTLVAVSADPEPNRGPGILLKADPNTGAVVYWADYPTVGFNKNWVVVQVNMFDIIPNAAEQATIGGTVGAINGMPTVDYANKRVYFASRQGTSNTNLWCLDLGAPSDALSLAWRFTGPTHVNGSPVLHNGRVYYGDVGVRDRSGSAAIVKLNAADGSIVSQVPLDPAPLTIGPPSLDLGYGMLHMGSEAGILYAVEVGF
jgi:hypothetical protein